MADILPPAPIGSPFGSYSWSDWYQKVRTIINGGGQINHNSLQGLQGGSSGDFYHLSASQFSGLNALIAASSLDWIYLKVTSDFTTTSLSPVDVPGLAFTPLASTIVVVEGMLLVSSSDVALGIKPGVSWPTGLDAGAAKVTVPTGTTTEVMANLTYTSGGSAAGTTIATTPNPYLAEIRATMSVSSTPSNQFKITLAMENETLLVLSGSSVTIKAGSWIRYRII